MTAKGEVAPVRRAIAERQGRILVFFFVEILKNPAFRLSAVFRGSERPCDQFLHDLVGAAINALDAGVGPHFGDRVFLHEAVAAM